MSIPEISSQLVTGVINFTNGMLSTTDQQLYPHNPKYLSTFQYLVPWVTGMETPYFDEWVKEVNEPDACEYFLQVFGYLLVAGNERQTAVFVKGPGANGKSTWFRMIDQIVGRKNISRVTLHQMTHNRFAGADLFGKVLNVVGDIGSAYIEDTGFFKAITGQDEVRAERKNAQPFDFTPYCVPVFSGNLIPPSNDPTHGYKRRWTHISFPNTFEPSADYEVRFDAEMPGIAYKAVMAYLNLKGQDFEIPDSALALKKEFDMKSDPTLMFLDERYDFDAKGHTPTSMVWRAYDSWCEEEGTKNKMRKSELFARLLQDPRITKGRIGMDVFKGIKRKPSDDTPASLQTTMNYLDD
jgi:P4 family phage/plasmid primase-like protien